MKFRVLAADHDLLGAFGLSDAAVVESAILKSTAREQGCDELP